MIRKLIEYSVDKVSRSREFKNIEIRSKEGSAVQIVKSDDNQPADLRKNKSVGKFAEQERKIYARDASPGEYFKQEKKTFSRDASEGEEGKLLF